MRHLAASYPRVRKSAGLSRARYEGFNAACSSSVTVTSVVNVP